MQILAIEIELMPLGSGHHELLREEAARVWFLKKQGIVRDIWFAVHEHVAVLLLECASEEEAKQHLSDLPLVRAGLITFDVIPLRSYDGFERLFDTRKNEE
jgi:muconolactone delta-isomerase